MKRLLIACLVLVSSLTFSGGALSQTRPLASGVPQAQGASTDGSIGYPISVVPVPGAAGWPITGTITANQGTSLPFLGNNGWQISLVEVGNTPIGAQVFGSAGAINAGTQSIPVAAGLAAWDNTAGKSFYLDMPDNPSSDAYNARNENILSVNSLPRANTGGDNWDKVRTPVIFKSASATAAGNTSLWTPAAGKKFRLMRYQVIVTDNATQMASGTDTIELLDNASHIGQIHPVFVPSIGLVNSGSLYSSPWVDLGNGILSSAANNVLNINLSAALNAGQVQVNCCGTEE